MKAEHLNAFINSTLYALNATMNTKAVRKNLKAAKPGETPTVGHLPGKQWVLASCNMEGRFCGHLSLSLLEKVAIPLAAKMVDEKIGEISPVVQDGIGELANVIAGAAQGLLSRQIGSVSLATVTVGESVTILMPPQMPSFRIGFETEYGNFNIDVALEEAAAIS